MVLAVLALSALPASGCDRDDADHYRHEACVSFVEAFRLDEADPIEHEAEIHRLSVDAAKDGRAAARRDQRFSAFAASLEKYRDRAWQEGDQGPVIQACNREAEAR
jgi:hypothetical protein